MRKAIILIVVILGCNSKKGPKINSDSQAIDFSKASVTIKLAGTIFPDYVDSLNRVDSTTELPSFLFNYLLDYEYPWVTDHDTWSLRKKIFESTKNTLALKKILESDDIRFRTVLALDSVVDKDIMLQIPYSNISTYEMAKQRLEELNKQK